MKKSITFLLVISFSLFLVNCQQSTENQKDKYEKIHESTLTIDTHNDTPLNMVHDNFDIGETHKDSENRASVDLPRMKAGGLDAAFFAVFIGQGDRTAEGYRKAKNKALEIFDTIHNSIGKNDKMAELALKSEDARKLKEKDKIAVYIGLENGYPINRDLANIDTFYNLGARYITLSHTRNNDICDSSTDPDGEEHGGLSDFGKRVVKKMNDIGMMIDVSHISDDALNDVFEVSEAPVIASHSCARALCDHPRNLSDEMLKKLKENGGVIQICFLTDYIKEMEEDPQRDSALTALREKYNNFNDLSDEKREKARKEWREVNKKYPKKLASVKDMVDHIDYVVETIGIDYVGIGTDFDGGARLEDCRDVSQMPNVTKELVKRGYNEEEIKKIWGENFLRVFKEVERLNNDE